MKAILIRVSGSLHAAVKDLAHDERVSMNELVERLLLAAVLGNRRATAIYTSTRERTKKEAL